MSWGGGGLDNSEGKNYTFKLELDADGEIQSHKASGTLSEIKSQPPISFKEILVGTTVTVSCELRYRNGTEDGQLIYSGTSDPVVIKQGENQIRIIMKGIFDDAEIFTMSEFEKIVAERGLNIAQIETFAIPHGYKTIVSKEGGVGSIFGECRNLKSVILPDSMEEIGSNAFTSCEKLESIYIPETVTVIESGAFSYCTSLEEISIPNSVTAIGEAAFSGCASLKTINLPKNSSFNTISKRMFQNSGISNIVIPESVTSIGDYAFYDCMGLSTVTLQSRPQSERDVISIGSDVFKYTDSSGVIPNLKIYVPYGSIAASGAAGPIPYYRSYRNNWTDYTDIIHTPFTSADYARAENAGTREYYTVPDGYTMISENAFAYRANLKGVTIPAEVESIEANAFIDCDNLASVLLKADTTPVAIAVRKNTPGSETEPDIFNGGNDGVRFYVTDNLATGYAAYYGNTRFNSGFVSSTLKSTSLSMIPDFDPSTSTECDIPYGYTAIASYCFSSNAILKKVTFNDTVEIIGEYAFQNCSALETVELPKNLKSIGGNAFYQCTSLKIVKGAGLKDGEFPKNLSTIGVGAFRGCSSLEDIVFPNSLTSISDGAFYGCASFTKITIPGNVQSIGSLTSSTTGAFAYCTGVKTITINEGVKTIGSFTFQGDYTNEDAVIKTIYIPKSVETIGEGAFQCLHNPNGYDVIFTDCDIKENTAETLTIGNYAFQNHYNVSIECGLKSITLPENLTSIGNGAFTYCNKLTEITIPSGVTAIGSDSDNSGVFGECTNLETITINGNITTIGKWAFQKTKLQSITIPDSVEIIGEYAFYECKDLETVSLCSEAKLADESGKLTAIGEKAFYNTKIETVKIPASVTSIEVSAFDNNSNLKDVYMYRKSSVPTLGMKTVSAFLTNYAFSTYSPPTFYVPSGNTIYNGTSITIVEAYKKACDDTTTGWQSEYKSKIEEMPSQP